MDTQLPKMKKSSLRLFRYSETFESAKAGQFIFKQGDTGETLYCVRAGTVHLMVGDTIVEIVEPGGIFGEVALVDSNPRSASALAATDCEIVPINRERFRYLVKNTPDFALEVMSLMAQRLRRMNNQRTRPADPGAD